MEWHDQGVILAARPQGDSSLVLSLLTAAHGRHRGLVRGARSSRQRGLYEPGNRVEAHWQARLDDHLGHYRLEPVRVTAGALLDDPLRLCCLDAAVALAETVLPEREPHPALFERLTRLTEALGADAAWAPAHLEFELTLLADSGFALVLDRCALTGASGPLAYVSPRSGRAVAATAAPDYVDRLLVLPRLLGGTGRPDTGPAEDMLDALALTGHFIDRHLLAPANLGPPAARGRYVDRWRELAAAAAVR